MNKIIICLMALAISLTASAQKKIFTFNQVFGGQFPEILTDLPQISGWADDDHYIEIKTDNAGKETAYLVNALTGKASLYVNTNKYPQLPEIDSAVNPTLSPDGKYVAFTRKNNLFIAETATGKETAVTTDGSGDILNGYSSWIYYEEILGRPTKYKAFWWSPDSKEIAYMRFDDSQVPRFPIYFAEGQHGELEMQHYPKVGDKNPEVMIGMYNLSNKKTTWSDFDAKKDQYFGAPKWTEGNELFVQWMNRGQDTLLVYEVNKTNGAKKLIYSETQPTWISLDDTSRLTFIPGNKEFILLSNKDGWDNLYLHDMSGKMINQITNGNFLQTTILYADANKKELYIKAKKENSTRFDLYKAATNGKAVTRLTFGDFSHEDILLSPKGKYFITIYSNVKNPPEMALVDNKGKLIRKLGTSKGKEFDNYLLPATKMVTVKSSDGKFDLPMTITYPVNFDSTKKYPVWISMYGGPDNPKVFDRWKPAGGLTQWWAQEGMIQVVMDNRGSGHFGKKGINYIFKQMGKWETEDFMSCGRWLGSQPWVNAERIGITGGSFGGYLTCMALTYGSDVFTHGIADYSVTSWDLYDTHYTERYMKTPALNPEGYKNTSVLTYLDKYKGMLRIVHGTTDDNVHLQHTLQLINKMEEMNLKFELMLYPGQRHGIGGTKSTHNILETMRFIYRYMLQKEFPKELGGN